MEPLATREEMPEKVEAAQREQELTWRRTLTREEATETAELFELDPNEAALLRTVQKIAPEHGHANFQQAELL